MIELSYVLLFILAYFAVFYMISLATTSYGTTKSGYLVANRNAGVFESTLGMIGCWLTGLGFLASGQQFFVNGWVGYFWFTFPQIVGLLIFAYLTFYVNQRVPQGYTTSSWISKEYGMSVGTIFQIVFILACFGNLATTFTALFKYIKFIDVGNTALITGLIVAGTALYGIKGGIKTSLTTSSIQTLLNIVLAFVLIYLGWDLIDNKVILDHLTGTKNISNIIDPGLMMAFGITAMLVFVTGPLMSATHHQKNYAQQNNSPWKTWAWGAPGYLLVQTLMAFFGIMALAWGGPVTDPSISQLFFFKAVGTGAIVIFGVILLNIACVIIDAHGNAIASIIAHDFVKDEKNSVLVARISMVAVAFIVWLIALQNFDLTKIFFTYGILRVNLFIILILILTTAWLTRRGILWSTVVMLPLTTALGLYGLIDSQPIYNIVAAITAFVMTPLLALLMSKLNKSQNL